MLRKSISSFTLWNKTCCESLFDSILTIFCGFGVSSWRKGTKIQTKIMFWNSLLKDNLMTCFRSVVVSRISFLCWLTRYESAIGEDYCSVSTLELFWSMTSNSFNYAIFFKWYSSKAFGLLNLKAIDAIKFIDKM